MDTGESRPDWACAVKKDKIGYKNVDRTRRYIIDRIFEEDGVHGLPPGHALPSGGRGRRGGGKAPALYGMAGAFRITGNTKGAENKKGFSVFLYKRQFGNSL